MNKEEVIKEYLEKVDSFSEEEIGEVINYFSNFYAQNYIKSKEEAFDILITTAIPKALSKLNEESKIKFKLKLLAI